MKRLLFLALLFALLSPARSWADSLTLGQVKETGKGYTITMQFPKLQGRDARVARAFNAAVRKPVDRAVAGFRSELPAVTVGGVGWDLQSRWTTRYRNPALISGLLTFSEFTGGAHPNPWLVSVNFDLAGGRELTLGQLFRPGHLQVLSRYAVAELEKRDLPEARVGAAPKAENFSVWTLGPQGLTLVFPPYQVGPYAAGTQEVLVPWKELVGVVRPGSLADRLARGEF